MNPTFFPQSNVTMHRPESMTDEECADLKVFADGSQVISAWRPTPNELVKINLGEPIFLFIMGPTMPPVWLSVDNPFSTPDKEQ